MPPDCRKIEPPHTESVRHAPLSSTAIVLTRESLYHLQLMRVATDAEDPHEACACTVRKARAAAKAAAASGEPMPTWARNLTVRLRRASCLYEVIVVPAAQVLFVPTAPAVTAVEEPK